MSPYTHSVAQNAPCACRVLRVLYDFCRYQCKLFTRFMIHYLHQHFKDKGHSEGEKGKEEEGKAKEEEGMREAKEGAVGQQDGGSIVFDTEVVDLEEDPGECADLDKTRRPEIEEAVQRYQKLSSTRHLPKKEEREGEGSKDKKEGTEEQLEIGECGCLRSPCCTVVLCVLPLVGVGGWGGWVGLVGGVVLWRTLNCTPAHTCKHCYWSCAAVSCRRVGNPRGSKEGSSSYRVHVRDRLAPPLPSPLTLLM